MNKTLKIIVWIVIIALAVWLIFFNDRKDSAQTSQEPIKIGVIAPLSGAGAPWGETFQRGINLALEEINNSGGIDGRMVEIIFEDDEFDPKKTVSAFTKLTDVDNVSAIIGPLGSANVQTVKPLILEKRIPTIVTVVGLTGITDDNEYLFRIWASEEIKAIAMKDFFADHKDSSVAIISSNQEASADFAKQLKEHVFSEHSISVVGEEIVDKGTKDFRSELSKLKKLDPDLLFINLYIGQIGLGAKQAKELGFIKPMFSSIIAESPTELELAAGAMEGMWLPGSPVPTESFKNLFMEKYGVEPDKAAAPGYDALMVIKQAIENSNSSDRQAVLRGLNEIDTYQGAFGEVSFNENRDAVLEIPIKKVEGDKFIVVTN